MATGHEKYRTWYDEAANSFSSLVVVDNAAGNLFIPKSTFENTTKASMDPILEHLVGTLDSGPQHQIIRDFAFLTSDFLAIVLLCRRHVCIRCIVTAK